MITSCMALMMDAKVSRPIGQVHLQGNSLGGTAGKALIYLVQAGHDL